MAWKSIIGQQRAKELLRRVIDTGEIAHAYLFHGLEGIGKDALAIEFAKVLNCERGGSEACDECENCRKIATLSHPNVQFVCALPVGKSEKTGDDPVEALNAAQAAIFHEQLLLKAADPYHRLEMPKAVDIKINSIRAIKRDASMSMFQEGRKCFIVSNAEKMNPSAATAFLKTLEEPPGNSVILLTSSYKENLLSTILSRCQMIHCEPLTEEDIRRGLQERDKIDASRAALAAKLANGSFTAARSLASDDIDSERKEATQFMRLSLQQKPYSLLTMIEDVLSGRDRNAMERWLRILLSWLRDALMIQNQAEVIFLNDEHRNDLNSFVNRFPQANLISAINSVEAAIDMVGRYVNQSLILTNLSLELRSYIKKDL